MDREIRIMIQKRESLQFMDLPYEWQIGGANPSDCRPTRREEETCAKPDLC
jgi:hypothetical protein